MIPKIIHYCWFGKGKKNRQINKCIKSWKKYCPDYQIIEWNESNFDVNCNNYCKKAYELKKYAFVSDMARLHAITKFGGVYLDTDLELTKNIDLFLNQAFISWESDTILGTAILGCEKGNKFFSDFLSIYDNIEFEKEDGLYLTNTLRITMFASKFGLVQNNSLQEINGIKIYPKEYFYPKDQSTGIVKIQKETHGIHHFTVSYISKTDRFRQKVYHFIFKYFGKKFAEKMYNIFGRKNI